MSLHVVDSIVKRRASRGVFGSSTRFWRLATVQRAERKVHVLMYFSEVSAGRKKFEAF